MALIQNLQTDAWWQDVTAPMLEAMRVRLRGLAHLIDRRARRITYIHFEDEIGEGMEVASEAMAPPDEFEKFRAKMRHFQSRQQDRVAIHKLRTNRHLAQTDLEELERMLRDSGIGTPENVARAKQSDGLGLFVRSLVGLDRAAAQDAFAAFLTGRRLSGNQIEFVDMLVEQLTQTGVMDAGRLYESLYTGLSPTGADGLFTADAADELISVLQEVRLRAAA